MRQDLFDVAPIMEDAMKYFKRGNPWGLDWYAFPQTWSSTALGFGGIGGAAMTRAQTVIVGYGNHFVVYFGPRFAYEVVGPNKLFFDDMKACHMASVKDHYKYIGHDGD